MLLKEQKIMVSIDSIKKNANLCRQRIIKLGMKGCFVGSALSCVDIITYLYYADLVSYDNSKGYFILSKGHAVPALYAVLEKVGAIESERFSKYNTIEDDLYLHPNANIPGVVIHSGSLGHGISIASGIAIDLKRTGENKSVYVMVGDGELNEGSNWEAIMMAGAQQLSNLKIIVDRNYFQANYPTEELVPLESLEDKFKSFGVNVKVFDGHDFEMMQKVFNEKTENKTKPTVYIAKTIRGKGIPSIENDWEQWYMEYDEERCEELLNELYKTTR